MHHHEHPVDPEITIKRRPIRRLVAAIKAHADGISRPEIAKAAQISMPRLQRFLDNDDVKTIRLSEAASLWDVLRLAGEGKLKYEKDKRRCGDILVNKKFLRYVIDRLIERFPDLTQQEIERLSGMGHMRLHCLLLPDKNPYMREEEWNALMALEGKIDDGTETYIPDTRVQLVEWSRAVALWNAVSEIRRAA